MCTVAVIVGRGLSSQGNQGTQGNRGNALSLEISGKYQGIQIALKTIRKIVCLCFFSRPFS